MTDSNEFDGNFFRRFNKAVIQQMQTISSNENDVNQTTADAANRNFDELHK